jgi:hypothetical protein
MIIMKRSKLDLEIKEARDALHEAAATIAQLANEKPRVQDSRPKTGNSKPNSVPVHPCGDHKKDVMNLEEAIIKAGAGGVVLLKAKDKSGKKKPFNLKSVNDLTLPFEVSLRSEKDTRIVFNEG